MALSYLPEAVPTAIGWAHPLTGEQLTAGALTAGQLDGDVPVSYYKPNAGDKSFLDPAGATRNLIFSVTRGQKVQFSVQSLDPIESIDWDFGDLTTVAAGPAFIEHVFAPGTYTITANVNYVGGTPIDVALTIVGLVVA